MSNELFKGRRIQIYALVEDHIREGLDIHMAQRRNQARIFLLEMVLFVPQLCPGIP